MAKKRIPRKKGQRRNSRKHSDLYTDENPKDTIKGLKFATVKDAEASVRKIKNSKRKHNHKTQAAIAMEQRAKVAGKKSAAAVYRRFIEQQKKKTKAKNETKVIRDYIRSILLETLNRAVESYLINLAEKAESGDLKGAVSGLVMGEYASEARQYVFDKCKEINWNMYPALKASGVRRIIPRRMPGFFGIAPAAAKVSAWLVKNRSDEQFKKELRQVVSDSLPKRMVA